MQRLTLIPRAIPTLALLGVMGLLSACSPGSKEIGATVADSETEGSATDGMTSEGSETESSTSLSGTSASESGESSSAEDTTGGVVTSCAEASTPTQCANASQEIEGCGWFEVTTWVSNDGVCSDVGIRSGHCFTTSQGDDGCGGFFDPTCPDGTTVVWYSSVGLEIGAVEIFVDNEGQTCSGPSQEFMPCSFDGETFDPPECACGCPVI